MTEDAPEASRSKSAVPTAPCPVGTPDGFGPPASEAELLEHAASLAGLTLGELAGDRLGARATATNLLRCKGLTGTIIEGLLGATAGSRDEPDFPQLGVELKTLPVSPAGKVQEVTFVCRVSFDQVADERWEGSRVQRKLKRVLFVPVETQQGIPLQDRRIGRACLFRLEGRHEDQIRSDWELLTGLLATGEADELTSTAGVALHLRPKAQNNRVRALAPAGDGGSTLARPKGFYLRSQFTAALLTDSGLLPRTSGPESRNKGAPAAPTGDDLCHRNPSNHRFP